MYVVPLSDKCIYDVFPFVIDHYNLRQLFSQYKSNFLAGLEVIIQQ